MRHWPAGKILVLNVDISVLEHRGHCWMGVLLFVVLSLGTRRCPRVARSSGSAETLGGNAGAGRDRIHTTLVVGNCARRL